MANKFEPLKIAVKNAAEKLGIAEYELFYIEDADISVETYRDEISKLSNSVEGDLFFRCILDGKLGYATTQLLTEDEMEALVARAVENARVIEKDDEAIIFGGAKPEDYVKVDEVDFTLPDAATLKNLAMDCRNVLYATDELIADGTECGASASESVVCLYNSKGLDLSRRSGNVAAYMEAVLEKGDEKVYDYDFAYSLEGFDKQALADKVCEGARAKRGASRPKTGKYNVIFSSRQMANILGTFVGVFFAESAQKGLSLLKGKVGEQIAAECVTIVDDPFYPENPLKSTFDGEGVPTRRKVIVEKGKLNTLLYNLTTAKNDGVETTGNASRSASSIGTKTYWFYIEPGELNLDELFAQVGDGIYVTEMKGFHAGANAITGDFSIESAGFLIENGKKAAPIKSFTVAGNFFELLKSIDTLSSDIDFRGPSYSKIAAPALLVRDVPVAGED